MSLSLSHLVTVACLIGTGFCSTHHHKHHRHHAKHHTQGDLPWVLAKQNSTPGTSPIAAGPVSNVPGVNEVLEAATNASEAFRSAKDAATAANDIATHSLKITDTARDKLDAAKNALRDARAESQGLSWDQREFLRQAEGKLQEATQEAEFGKLQQAKYVYPDAHGERYTVGKASYLRNLEHQLSALPESGSEGVKGEEAHLHRELFTLRQQLESKKHDAKKRGIKYTVPGASTDSLDDKSVDDLLKDIDELEHLLGKLENAPKGGGSQDELKAEIEKLWESMHKLEVRALTEPELVARQLHGLKELKSVLTEIPLLEKKLGETTDAKFKAPLQKDLDGLNAAAQVLEEDLGIQPAEVDALLSRLGQEVGELKLTLPDAPPITTTPVPALAYEIPEKRRITGRIRSLSMGQESSQGYNLRQAREVDDESTESSEDGESSASPGGIDIDTAMPYGELEPFGREDTAQELTEASIHESDAMVDQIERAEVSEEKRAVFRALTRLRGAAITSFDGVARSQTGNIDEYNKVHQWRNTHPLHHLADEESDISKWAFPEDADF